ncbi:MAG: S16 family serine protease [Lachnospiraceae bacterium]
MRKGISVSAKRVPEFLGRCMLQHDRILEHPQPGIVTGPCMDTGRRRDSLYRDSIYKGNGKLTITGQLGDVMKESAAIAVTLVKELYPEKAELFAKNDLHIHVPAGAVPKDGPSAGITLVTALSSLVSGKPVNPEIAMTGEVSLRGGIMPIGGLPEKLMAAQRAGVKKVYIPKDNMPDLEDVAAEVRGEADDRSGEEGYGCSEGGKNHGMRNGKKTLYSCLKM